MVQVSSRAHTCPYPTLTHTSFPTLPQSQEEAGLGGASNSGTPPRYPLFPRTLVARPRFPTPGEGAEPKGPPVVGRRWLRLADPPAGGLERVLVEATSVLRGPGTALAGY